MRNFSPWMCLVVLYVNAACCQNVVSKEIDIFRLVEGSINLSPAPAKEWSSCVVVHEGGTIYMEIRSHLISEPQAELKAYSGQLTDAELENLQQLVTDNSLMGVSDGHTVRPPPTNTVLAWITAEIERGSSTQEIDYRYWKK